MGCIEGAADRTETVDVLVKWAKGDVSDTRNPLLRAFVLNHPVLGEKVTEASSELPSVFRLPKAPGYAAVSFVS